MSEKTQQVLLLGLDAADGDLIRDMSRAGRLPHIGEFIAGGLFGRLDSPAALYAGGVWPEFYTGVTVARHGIYHNKQWRPEAMRAEVPDVDWLGSRPLWEAMSDQGVRLCLVDVPMVLGRPRRINGVNLAGWGTHDLIRTGSWPKPLWPALKRRHGRPCMPREHFGHQSAEALDRLVAKVNGATRQLCDIAVELLAGNDWQFGCVVFGAAHRAGHYLWDRSQVADSSASNDDPDARLQLVYEQLDQSVGRLLAALPAQTLVVLFAVHGMGPNPGWSDLLADILAKLESHRGGAPAKRGLAYALKQNLPHHWFRPILERLPGAVTDRLVPLWSRAMFDWSRTQFFPLPMDSAGYLRVNLHGREARGIVSPGDEYDAVCAEVESLITGLRDSQTGQPIAAQPVHAYAEAPADSPARQLLPDIVVPWRGPRATESSHLVCDAFPDFVYEVKRPLPSGRSGNHTPGAWFAARGPGVVPGNCLTRHRVVDLMPTAMRALGVSIATGIDGRPINLRAGG